MVFSASSCTTSGVPAYPPAATRCSWVSEKYGQRFRAPLPSVSRQPDDVAAIASLAWLPFLYRHVAGKPIARQNFLSPLQGGRGRRRYVGNTDLAHYPFLTALVSVLRTKKAVTLADDRPTASHRAVFVVAIAETYGASIPIPVRLTRVL